MIFGYLDAGSGSLLLQAVLGGLAGVAVAFKAWKARVSGKKTPQTEDTGSAADEAMLGSET